MKTMISRRSFLCAAGIASASAVLTACGGSSSSTASSAAGSGSAFAFRVGFFTGFSAGASAALGLRPGFFASFSVGASGAALGLRPGFFTAFSAGAALVVFLAAVFLPGFFALSAAVLAVRFVGTSKYRVLMGGRVMVMLCSKPCMGFLWVRTGLLWTAPEPPKAASSLFSTSL